MASFAPRLSHDRYERRRAVAASLIAAVVTGLIVFLTLGSGGRASNSNRRATPNDVASTVQAFGQALGGHDFTTICNDLFTASARDAAGGSACASSLSMNSVMLSDPKVRLGSISLHGSAATATISVSQPHQPTTGVILQLVREGGQFRIASVVSPGD